MNKQWDGEPEWSIACPIVRLQIAGVMSDWVSKYLRLEWVAINVSNHWLSQHCKGFGALIDRRKDATRCTLTHTGPQSFQHEKEIVPRKISTFFFSTPRNFVNIVRKVDKFIECLQCFLFSFPCQKWSHDDKPLFVPTPCPLFSLRFVIIAKSNVTFSIIILWITVLLLSLFDVAASLDKDGLISAVYEAINQRSTGIPIRSRSKTLKTDTETGNGIG